ncbi:MAG TPA: peroxide stress protein YaaA [Candidatus Limnocylindria bacterium]
MLVILPPSETKRPPPSAGTALDLDDLSFPELGPMRTRVIDALIATSLRSDALERLGVRSSLRPEVARNEALRDLPTRRAADTYAGPLYGGLDSEGWSPGLWAQAERHLVIVSGLWGALRPADRIPAYRLHVCSRLAGLDRLEPMWRTLLPDVLNEAAEGEGPILDVRSRSYLAVGRPPYLDDQTVTLRVRPSPGGPAHIGDVIAKRVRGEAARHVLASADDVRDPLDIADRLRSQWSVEIEPPSVRHREWLVTLEVPSPGA